MKKLLFAFIATIMLTGVSFGNEKTVNHSILNKEESLVSIKISIDFGRKSKGCTGFGVCSITIEAEIDVINFEKRDGRALSEASKVGNGLELIIYQESLTENTIKEMFSSDYLLIEEDYNLDAKAAKEIGFNSGYTIKAGKYKITKVEGGYKVNL